MINIIGKLEEFEKVAVWGFASEPKTKVLPSGKTVTDFQLLIGKDPDDSDTKIYIRVQVWEKLAKQFASLIDRNDLILVIGTCRKDNYWTERNQKETFYVSAEFLINQTFHGDEQDNFSGFSDDDMMNLP